MIRLLFLIILTCLSFYQSQGQCGMLKQYNIQSPSIYKTNNVYARIKIYSDPKTGKTNHRDIVLFDKTGQPLINIDSISWLGQNDFTKFYYNQKKSLDSIVTRFNGITYTSLKQVYLTLDSSKYIELNHRHQISQTWIDFPKKMEMIHDDGNFSHSRIYYDFNKCPDSLYMRVNQDAFFQTLNYTPKSTDNYEEDTLRIVNTYEGKTLLERKYLKWKPHFHLHHKYDAYENGLWKEFFHVNTESPIITYEYILFTETEKIDLFTKTYNLSPSK